jgi:hypothetical protein
MQVQRLQIPIRRQKLEKKFSKNKKETKQNFEEN